MLEPQLTSFVRPQNLSENEDPGPTKPKENARIMSESSVKYTTDQFRNLLATKPYDNVFISPYNLWSALTLTYLGAKGKTGSELAKVLGFEGTDRSTVGSGYLELDKDIRKMQGTSKNNLAIASKLIFDYDVHVKEYMVDKYFDELARMNFTLNPQESRDRINEWVESQTKNKIKNLIPAGAITRQTRIVIVNAVYFKGEWHHVFDPAATIKEFFKLPSGAMQKVDMMKIKTQLYYGEDATLGAQLVNLPYSSGDFSMLIMLPKGENTVNDVIDKLNADNLKTTISQMSEANVVLRMPKFTLEDDYDMVNVLSKMGVNSLFENADLTGYTDESLSVSSVIHKAVIEVNEKGTEAAGATAVIMCRTSIVPTHVTMTVDKPFIFLIRANNQNVVLFMGVVNNPGGEPVCHGL